MTFGEKLLQLRRARGLSQEELAMQLGVSRQAISRWELDSALPDIPNLLRLCRHFGVSSDYMIDDTFGKDALSAEADAPQAGSKVSPAPSRAMRGTLITGIVLAGLGALGNLVIFILSTMILSRVRYSYQDGDYTVYTSKDGYALSGFIETYHLEALVALLVLLLFVGGCLIIWALYRRYALRHQED